MYRVRTPVASCCALYSPVFSMSDVVWLYLHLLVAVAGALLAVVALLVAKRVWRRRAEETHRIRRVRYRAELAARGSSAVPGLVRDAGFCGERIDDLSQQVGLLWDRSSQRSRSRLRAEVRLSGLVLRLRVLSASGRALDRARAAHAFGAVPLPETVPDLARLMADGDEHVRSVAAGSLGRSPTPAAARVLFEALLSRRLPPRAWWSISLKPLPRAPRWLC